MNLHSSYILLYAFALHRLLTIKQGAGDPFAGSPTVKALRALFDNYEPNVHFPENETAIEKREQDVFIDAILKTNEVRILMDFLVEKQ